MRVLHVYAGNLYGGIEAILRAIARERAAVPEMEPRFALAFDGRLARELRETGVDVDLVGGARLSRPWTVWRARRRLRQVIAEAKPDVCVLHSAWTWAVFAPAVRRTGIPAAFWIHDAVSGDVPERIARRTKPALAICLSEYIRGTLPRLFPHTRAEVVYPPVSPPPPVESREEVRAELETSPGTVVIVQASRMEPWKGHRLHLQALGLLRDDPRWTCWLAGGAQRPHELRYRDELRALASDLGIAERIRWLGDRADIPRILAAADVLCQPNRVPEPFGVTFVEAMHAHLPVVGVALGGAMEIVTEATGILARPDDAQSIADALRRLIGDPDRRARLGDAGPDRARELCDPPRQLRRLHAVLAEVAA
jgi:glycosyltransferase involved in cell wall biosynthesis